MLNPFGDPLYDDNEYGYDQLDSVNNFTVIFSTWPVVYQYCIQTMHINKNKPQAQLPIKYVSCFRELAENIVKTTSRSNIRKKTSSNDLLKNILEYKNLRDSIFRQATETLEHIRENHYNLSNFSFDHFTCPFRKDEYWKLYKKLLNEVWSIQSKVIKFNRVTFIILFKNKTSLVYFNRYRLPQCLRLRYGTDKFTFSKDLAINNTSFKYISKRCINDSKISRFVKNLYLLCNNDVLKCSWYFICDSKQMETIEVDKVCDFNFDCKDLSDEKYCSEETHFNCSSGFPISIKRTKVNDNQVDCSDRSDECMVNPISSAEEIIKNLNLRKYIWFSIVAIVVLNTFAIIKCCNEIKNLDKTRLINYYNLIFLINLSFSDIIFGFVLATLAFFSKKFSGYYCLNDLRWRSSIPCNVIGVLTIISSQTSLNLLVLMTGFRLYTVYKPFNSLHDFKKKITLLLLTCWFLPIIISLTPIIFHNKFIQSISISSNMFEKNKIL